MSTYLLRVHFIGLFFIVHTIVWGAPINGIDLHDGLNYSDATWLTAHNAFANKADGWLYPQQNLSVREQLDYGVRSFMIDLHWFRNLGEEPFVALCHEYVPLRETAQAYTDLLLTNIPSYMLPKLLSDNKDLYCPLTKIAKGLEQPKSLKEFLQEIKFWLSEYPRDIITLHFENRLGNDPSIEVTINNLLAETGALQYLFPVPSNQQVDEWPTLGEMRNKDHRLVIFSDNKQDGMINVSSYSETRYDLGNYPGCEMREEGRSLPELSKLFVLNHFYKFSVYYDYEQINSYESIMDRVLLCKKEISRTPNFVTVDFIEKGKDGGARQVVVELNQQNMESRNQSQTNALQTIESTSVNRQSQVQRFLPRERSSKEMIPQNSNL